MKPSPADQAEAFGAAVRELSRRYPPCKVPKLYPMSSMKPWQTYTVHEEDKHQRMIHAASYGRINEVLNEAIRSGIPRDELVAVIALIYG